MTKQDLARKVYETSHLTGNFKLRSGKVSQEYFDKYLFESDPVLLQHIAAELVDLIPEGTEILAGLEMGGIPVATALSLQTGIPAVFVRKKVKEYGTCKIAEGTDITGKKVCIVEDVVTTGGQILLSATDLRDCGADVAHVLSVILRDPAAGARNLKEKALELHTLFTMEDLEKSVEGELQ